MAKFEITNPEAIKFIADLKSGVLIKPYLDKVKKIKWTLISILFVFILILFIGLGKSLFNRSVVPTFMPPSLDNPRVSTIIRQKSEFDELREEIFSFSSDLPDPVMPELNNHINLQKEDF